MTPGLKSFGDFPITTAGTVLSDVIEDLDGALAMTLSARLAYGSGGTSVKAFVQSSLDNGATWFDVWCASFTTAGAHKVVNLSGLTPKTTAATPGDGALTDDTVVDGVLGDLFRVKVVTVGTYAGSTVLSMRAVVR